MIFTQKCVVNYTKNYKELLNNPCAVNPQNNQPFKMA